MADVGEEGEVYLAAHVLLVVADVVEQAVVVLAGEGEVAVGLADEAHRLMEMRRGEPEEHRAQVEFADNAPGHSITVEHGAALAEGQTLEGMAEGVPEVEGLAEALLVRVLADDALLDVNALLHQAAEGLVVGMLQILLEMVGPHFGVVEQRVLEHFGIARADIRVVECAEKHRVNDNVGGRAERTDFVFQPGKVDACLATDSGIDHAEKGGGNIDKLNAALERGCRESAQVCHYAAAQIDEQRVATSPFLRELLPDAGEGVKVLGYIARLHGEHLRIVGSHPVRQQRQAVLVGLRIVEEEYAVVSFFQHAAANGIGYVVCI